MTDFTTLSFPSTRHLAALRMSAGEPAALPATTRLLPRPLRHQLVTFNRFIRLADKIADDQELGHEAKLARLDALERALEDGQLRHTFLQPALDLRHSLRRCGIQNTMARDMLAAFRRDVKGVHCQNWSDLLAYCRQSAAPIGRMLLALHGEGPSAHEASDALCAAMRGLSLLQDCRADWVIHGRCYLPRRWFHEMRLSPERLIEQQCDAKTRHLFDRALDAINGLLIQAAPLPGLLHRRALRLEIAVAYSTSRALSEQLRLHDPLTRRITVPAPARFLATVRGLLKGVG